MTESTFQSQVQLAAQRLKAELWNCLEGRTHPGFRDNTHGSGPSAVVGISFPTNDKDVGICNDWTVQMNNHCGLEWTTGLSAFLPEADMYGLFQHFLGSLPIKLQQPELVVFADRDEPPSRHRRFVKSWGQIQVTKDYPALIPAADELTVGQAIKLSIERNPLGGFGFGIEALLHVTYHREKFQGTGADGMPRSYDSESGARQDTFYIKLGGAASIPRFLPIARIVGVHGEGEDAAITLELQNGLEAVPYVPGS